MIIVLFGQPCSGKSTIAKELGIHNIDGDRLRDLFANKDYSREGRMRNLNRASDIVHYLNSTWIEEAKIVLSLVYPYKEARDYLNSLTQDIKWVYLTYEGKRGRENFHVEDFQQPIEEKVLHLNTSTLSIEECVSRIKKYINE